LSRVLSADEALLFTCSEYCLLFLSLLGIACHSLRVLGRHDQAGLSPGCKGNPGHISCISDHQATASRMDSQDNHDIMALIAGKTLIVANDQRARCPISTQSANIPSEHLSWTGILPWHPPVRRNPSSRVLRAGEIVGVQPFPNSPRLHTHKVDDLLCFSRRLDFRSK
jgi:hypothetical protein